MLTAVVAAIEALAVAIAGIAVVAIPALLLWTVTFGLAAEPSDVATNISAVWFLGHFVPLTFSLTQETAVSFGLAAAPLSFTLSLAPLGITLVTVLLAMRSGWRFGRRGGTGVAGVVGGALGFALVAGLVAPIAQERIALSPGIAVLISALVYGCASAAAFLVRAARDEHEWWQAVLRWKQQGLDRLGVSGSAALPARLAEAVRLAAALLAGVVGVAGVGLAVAIVAGYVSITTLSQNLQLDAVGAILLFLLQLAYLPTMLIWGISWFSGAGFAVGIGSSASPFGALLGPMPALPMFGAIPQGWGGAGVIAPLLLALVGLGIGVLFASRDAVRRASWTVALTIAAVSAVLVGLAVTGLAALATGSIGPDRLASVGPAPWLVGGLVALELGVGVLLGVAARKTDYSRLRAVLPDLSEASAQLPGLQAVRSRRSGSDVSDSDVSYSDVNETYVSEPEAVGSESFAFEEYETVELETASYEFESPARDPELYDHASAESGPDPEPGPDPELYDQASADPEPATSLSPGQQEVDEQETEELLRAYSWDAPDSSNPDDAAGGRKGWRWPGREH